MPAGLEALCVNTIRTPGIDATQLAHDSSTNAPIRRYRTARTETES